MKIALIGVPGSRKSDLADELARNWFPNLRVVDEYVERLHKRTDYLYGYRATYIGNLHIALERWAKEVDPSWMVMNTVTCGTILETMVYNVLYYIDQQQYKDVAIPNWVRGELSVQTLGALYADTWNYDHAFYLEPFNDEHEELDARIREAIVQFGTDAHVIGGPFEDRVIAVKELCDQATATDKL